MFSSKLEMIYFGHRMALWRVREGSKQLRIFPVWWGLVLAFGWDTLTSWPVVSYASRAALIASSFEMSSQWLGHEWVWHLDPGQDRQVGCGSPRPWKSGVQFLDMNSRVQVPSVGQTHIDVSGGDRGSPAADTCQVQSLVAGHFLMKSARRVSTSRALLAWLVDRHTVVSRFLMVESWPKACWRGGKIEVCFKRFPDLFGKEFALCSLSLVSPKEARRNGLCMRMGPL